MLLSIIVPIYNIENYVKKCIDSLIKNSPNECEILLIDDGSTDNSGEICDNSKSTDRRIKVFHKKNGGLADARNFGINNACGDFVCFVDGDDYVNEKFSQIDKKIDKNCQMCIFGMNAHYLDRVVSITQKDQIYCGEKIFRALRICTKENSAWMKIVSRKFIIENCLFFKKGFAEDFNWTGRCFLKVNSIQKSSLTYYEYFAERQNSIMNVYKKQRFFDIITQAKDICDEIEKSSCSKKIKKRVYQYIGFNILSNFRHIKKLNKEDKSECIALLEENKHLISTQKGLLMNLCLLFGNVFGWKAFFNIV